jgi:hypothetical protein
METIMVKIKTMANKKKPKKKIGKPKHKKGGATTLDEEVPGDEPTNPPTKPPK